MLPNEIAGKYELRGTLGSGAMGVVYDALDRMIERRVAIKIVRRPPGDDPETEEANARFRREAQAAGRLSHPNIVGVYDYGENADSAWIVMELVEGGSLKGKLDKQERFPVPEIVRVMDQMLAALAYSHGRGVVHRDIKPANIMLGTDGSVKLADFGIARLENSSMTQVGTVMGTPSYMAPEQLRGETVDARADIWASGVVLYQLLTGEKPFEGGFSAVMHKALHTEPPPPSQLAVTAPRSFDAVVAKAMAKRPEDRYPSAAAFAEAIRAAANPQATAPAGPTQVFADAGPLPGMDAEATMVASRPTAAPAPKPTAASAAATAKPAGGKLPVVAIGGGVVGLAAVAGIAWFVLQPAPVPPPPVTPQAQQQQRPAEDPTLAAEQARQEAEQRTRDEAARTEQARRASEQARLEAEQRARDEAQRAAQADQALQLAERRAREEAARAELARQQQQTDQARQAADLRAREEAQRVAQAREDAERAQRQADLSRAEAERRAREDAQRTEEARRAEQARLQDEQRRRAEAGQSEQAQRAEQQAREEAARREQARQEQLRQEVARQQAEREQAERERLAREEAARRPDYRAAAAAAVAAAPCSLLSWSATDTGLVIAGVVRRGGEVAVQQALASRGVRPEAAQLRLQRFEGPYCGVLDTLRPVLAPPDAAPRVGVLGTTPLAKGELLRFEVGMPATSGQLYVAYLMQSGDVAHLVNSRPEAANAQPRLGDPRPGFPGWEVDEPFGTDLVLAFASDRPIFTGRRPVVEKLDDYLAGLAAALRNLQGQGGRVSVRAAVVETVARR